MTCSGKMTTLIFWASQIYRSLGFTRDPIISQDLVKFYSSLETLKQCFSETCTFWSRLVILNG